jgi:hypothetical protein
MSYNLHFIALFGKNFSNDDQNVEAVMLDFVKSLSSKLTRGSRVKERCFLNFAYVS